MTPTYASLKRAAKQRKSRPRSWGGLPQPSKRPKSVNRKRKASNFARAYGSAARVEFIKGLPCVGCGVMGYSENAHVASGGQGRKADASQIVPLCGPRLCPVTPDSNITLIGCHRLLHLYGRRDLEKSYGVDLDAAAAATEVAWQSVASPPKKRSSSSLAHLGQGESE